AGQLSAVLEHHAVFAHLGDRSAVKHLNTKTPQLPCHRPASALTQRRPEDRATDQRDVALWALLGQLCSRFDPGQSAADHADRGIRMKLVDAVVKSHGVLEFTYRESEFSGA